MASHQYDSRKRSARYFFRLDGRQYNQTLKVDSDRHAELILDRIKKALEGVERGTLVIPPGVSPKDFIVAGGVVEEAKPSSAAGQGTIEEVFGLYRSQLTSDAKAQSSLATERVHEKHFVRIFGPHARWADLGVSVVQRYVDRRAKEGVGRETLKKELGTLRYVWAWAHKRGHLSSGPPWGLDEITLPKGLEKPPFQTWEQIERQISRGKLTPARQAALWECLWLNREQVAECLLWVRDNAPAPCIYPMFAFAAYTGARRGEMVRSMRSDWDFDLGVVSVRERKADRSKHHTTRNVSIHPRLNEVMREWFAESPDDVYTIEHKTEPLTIVEATKWFRRTVDGGPWAVLRGWHVFRHSLASNMAAAGVDQRIIDGVLGHSTASMSRRYRHLLPGQQADAILRAM